MPICKITPLSSFSRRLRLHTFVMLSAWIVIFAPRDVMPQQLGLASVRALPAAEEEARILAEIRRKGHATYTRFAGVRSRRHSAIRTYDAKSGELLQKIELSAERIDYYDGMPYVNITRYVLDGVEQSPASFENYELAPPHPVFDERGAERYNIRLVGSRKIRGTPCWRLHIMPKRNGRRYFRGDMFFTKDDLNLVYMKGTFASLQFGLQDFEFDFHFVNTPEGAPLFQSGFARGTVYVPLIMYKKFTSSMEFENMAVVRK